MKIGFIGQVRNGMGPISQEVVSRSFLTALVSYVKVNFHNVPRLSVDILKKYHTT